MTKLLPILKQRYWDDNGDPLVGGKLYSYLAGTTTPVATYIDASGDTPNTNPIILDGAGQADVWIGGGTYKFVLADANDVVLWTRDNVSEVDVESQSLWAVHAIVDGQAATNLVGETLDLTLYSSAKYDAEITRGTTVFSGGPLEIQNVNGTARVIVGPMLANELNGVTFSISQVGTLAQLLAAADVGAGSGKIKLSRRLVGK